MVHIGDNILIGKFQFVFLDVEEGRYPYYLMSVQQILESSQEDEYVSYILYEKAVDP